MPYETHDFHGITFYHCPHCKFDSDKIPVLRAHVWNAHERQRHMEREAAERPAATLFGADGQQITRIERGNIERGESAEELSEDFTAGYPPEGEHE